MKTLTLSVSFCFVAFACQSVFAQGNDAANPVTAGQTANSGQNAATAGQAVGGQDVSQAFATGIQRDAGTIGATADSAASFSNAGTAGAGGGRATGGAGGLGGGFGGAFGGAFNQLFGFGQGQQASGQKILRTRLRSGVELPSTLRSNQASAIRTRMAKLPVASRMTGVSVSLEGRTALLTGAVATAKDKRLAEMLMKLEPGVSSVNNQLTVLQQP